jgi:glyoxylase I family protein
MMTRASTASIAPSPGGGAIINGMGLVGLHHVSINVDDVDAALGFYVGVLGLKVRPDRPDFSFGGAWLDAGGQQVHLIEATSPPDLGQHFALAFTDLPELVGALRDQGFQVSDPVRSGTSLQSFMDDPAGNRVELHQPGVFAADR